MSRGAGSAERAGRTGTGVAGLLLGLVVALAPAAATSSDSTSSSSDSTVLEISGMTFVGSRGSSNEVVLRAERATFLPDTDMAKLEGVRAVVTNPAKGKSFEMTCDRADLNVETHDFLAQGHVEGVTGDGQHYSAPWVRYEHEQDLLSTDAPVVMVDSGGSFRGDGFRYHVKERRFKLLGNVTVVQGK